MQKKSFNVSGTTCASCELLLERELAEIPGVQSVDASHKNAIVTLMLEDGVKIKPQDLEALVGSHGYRFRPVGDAKRPDDLAPARLSVKRIGGTIILVTALFLLLKSIGFLSFSPSVSGAVGFWAVFTIGIVAAFSSCTAVVSGLIVAISAKAAAARESISFGEKMRPHMLFNAGRIVGFAGFGGLIGLVGSAVALSPGMSAFLVMAIAILMIGLGINLLELVPAGTFSIRPPKFIGRRVHALSTSENPLVPFVVGAGTFFLPCGFTQSVQLLALSTGDPLQASTIMLVFALGTLPALLGVGFAASSMKGNGLKLMSKAAGAFVIVLGISNMQNGWTLLGFSTPSATASVDMNAPAIVDGKQFIQMEITQDFTYAPDMLVVTEGVPVVWEVYGSEWMGCADTLVSRTLGINTTLEPGINEVRFTPTKPGTHTFSCSMGMIRGTMIVESAS